MPTRNRHRSLAGAFALAALVAGTVTLSAQPPGAEPLKKPADTSKTEKSDKPDSKVEKPDGKPLAVKLPDGTFLWLGSGEGERVTLSPQEYQKLLDRVDQLKKELAARKPTAPSGCAIRGRVEKRGEQLVAVLKLTYTFRTTQANTAIALGGRKAFLVGAALDGSKLPVLDTSDDGFTVLVEAAGDHTLVFDTEAPVTARVTKAEIGFDLGLPRAPITTFALDPPGGDVKRVTLVTKAPDQIQPRRTTVDVKELAAKGSETGVALGAVESLEVSWEPPAAVAQPVDQVQNADIDVTVLLTDGFVESTAKIKVRGPAREWKLVAPASADVSVDRVAVVSDTGPTQQPVVSKPGDPNKPAWKIELPSGSTAADWIITVVVRQARPKTGTTKAPASPIGPFAVLDVFKQTGTVNVKAGPHTRFVFKHGPDLRRVELPIALDDDVSAALFRLTTGPTGATPVNAPLLTVEAWPVEGAVRVRPVYKLELTEASWKVRAEIAVKPIRTEVDAITINVPAEWRGLESEFDPETVQSASPGKVEGAWVPVTVRLANATKLPFNVVLAGTIAVPSGGREVTIPFPRYPKAVERDAVVTATVYEGMEVRGTGRGWEGDQPAGWSSPLTAVVSADGKTPKAVTAVTGRSELGFARVALNWQPYRPDVAVTTKTDVTVGERQITVKQEFHLRSGDGLPKAVRLHGPAEAFGLRATPALDSVSPGAWTYLPPDAKEATLNVSFALPLPTQDGPLTLPIGLFWLADAARTETNVRVWVNSVTGRTVSAAAPGWRELPTEALPERDTLPALTLTASAEHSLALELRRATTESAVAVWVDRALVEAGATEDGAVSYRARFRLSRWLAPAIEVWLPGAIGPNPTARIDGTGTALVPAGEADGRHRFRVNLPEISGVRAVVLELQYTLPGSRSVLGETAYQPPRIFSAAHSGPVRWLVTEASGSAPFLFSDRARPELRWRWRGPVLAPTAVPRSDLERWFNSGGEPDAVGLTPTQEGEPLAARQNTPGTLRVARVPWIALVIVSSLGVFLVAVLLTWLNTVASGLAVALLGGTFGVAAVLYPQPAAQVVAAGQPGLVVALLALSLQMVVRWEIRRRVRNLPGFTRAAPEPATGTISHATPAASVRVRPGSTGTPAPTGSGS
ncbi:hypothetical protein VT84_01660 [Gemmata sp. SH-PL17]|uniref:hypothetical protein n=1 Tax=Gemmata sp. SH-PL17 TaxID=1630693 RepID=UPI00078B7F80|nr:hypothetical protein [Gemmata sp. SH-PL17]AMV23088.1 hypothetical protein VT84_01660 [Gemmata sp. SH-PL17]